VSEFSFTLIFVRVGGAFRGWKVMGDGVSRVSGPLQPWLVVKPRNYRLSLRLGSTTHGLVSPRMWRQRRSLLDTGQADIHVGETAQCRRIVRPSA